MLGCYGVVPGCTVREGELHAILDVKANPFGVFAGHFDIHDTACKALPIAAVFHKEVDRAVLSLGHAVAVRIDVVAEPVGAGGGKTDADASLCPHAAVRGEVALDDGAVCPCAYSNAVGALDDVDVDDAGILGDELTVGANRCPGVAPGQNTAAADVDG